MVLHLIASATASSSATLEFTSGIDSTFNEYQFQFVNMHPQTDEVNFSFQFNAVGESGFNETITSTVFKAYHNEADGTTSLGYDTARDQTQGTGFELLGYDVGNDNDQSVSGVVTLYAPSSTTYVKHFVTRTNVAYITDYTIDFHTAGYINTTAAIDEIQFKMSSGNIDAGTIYMYGVG